MVLTWPSAAAAAAAAAVTSHEDLDNYARMDSVPFC